MDESSNGRLHGAPHEKTAPSTGAAPNQKKKPAKTSGRRHSPKGRRSARSKQYLPPTRRGRLILANHLVAFHVTFFPDGPRVGVWAPSARNQKLAEHYFSLAIEQLLDDAWRCKGETHSQPTTFIDKFHEGERRARAIDRIYTQLVQQDVDPDEALSLCRAFNEARCREPLDQDEIWEIINKAAARILARRGQCGCGCGGC